GPPMRNNKMHDFARPLLAVEGAAEAVAASNCGKARPVKPSAPTRSTSRREAPSQSRVPGPRNESISGSSGANGYHATVPLYRCPSISSPVPNCALNWSEPACPNREVIDPAAVLTDDEQP